MTPSHQSVLGHADHLKRRLSDSILQAFHAACDEGATEIAWRLLGQLERIAVRGQALPSGADQRQHEDLAAPRERLHNLILWESLAISRCQDVDPTHQAH
jgi:hypothetical protein